MEPLGLMMLTKKKQTLKTQKNKQQQTKQTK